MKTVTQSLMIIVGCVSLLPLVSCSSPSVQTNDYAIETAFTPIFDEDDLEYDSHSVERAAYFVKDDGEKELIVGGGGSFPGTSARYHKSLGLRLHTYYLSTYPTSQNDGYATTTFWITNIFGSVIHKQSRKDPLPPDGRFWVFRRG